MKLYLCIATAQPDLVERCLRTALSHATTKPGVVVFGNGCRPAAAMDRALGALDTWSCASVAEADVNGGVPVALHRLYELAKTVIEGKAEPEAVLAFLHDDLFIHEDGWDARVLSAFEADPKLGLVGFGGATGLAGDEIYKVPYELPQLGRRNFYSNMVGAEIHGARITHNMPAVFVDGYSMIVRKTLMDKIGGWAWFPKHITHYGYDAAIACQTRRHGYSAMVVPCDVQHGAGDDGMGAMTRLSPIHQEMAKAFGGDDEVHRLAHEFVYSEFRDVLPLRLP